MPAANITWRASYTTDAPEKVISHSEGIFGPPEHVAPNGSVSFSLPKKTMADDSIGVSPAAVAGPWNSCDTPKGAASIILDSSAVATY